MIDARGQSVKLILSAGNKSADSGEKNAIEKSKQANIMKIVLITNKANGRTQTREFKTVPMARYAQLVFGGRVFVDGKILDDDSFAADLARWRAAQGTPDAIYAVNPYDTRAI